MTFWGLEAGEQTLEKKGGMVSRSHTMELEANCYA